MSKPKLTEREVPPVFVEELKLEAVRGLTLRERLRLLLGYNLLFTAIIKTQHRVGKTHQGVKVELTKRLPDAPPQNRTLFVGKA